MKQRQTYRIYPTKKQEEHLAKTFGCCRFTWNWALALRTKEFKDGNRIGLYDTMKFLPGLKKEHEWLREVSSVCLQQSLMDLQLAFSSFFDKRSKYPKFKSKEDAQSCNYTKTGFTFDPKTKTLKIAKIGKVKVKWSRKKILNPSSIRILKTCSGKYFVSFVVDIDPVQYPKTGKFVGIDFGVNRLATLSDGETISNPKYTIKYAKRLAFLQKQLSRKQKGSNSRKRAKIKVAKLHEKIANSRKDHINKLAHNLTKKFDTIFVEDLNVRDMVKNHNLSKCISDAGMGSAIVKLEQKALAHGKKVIKIDRFYPSSKTCSCCGHLNQSMSLSVRSWSCPKCNTLHDRDKNASLNILAVGQTVAASGGTVRPSKVSALEGKSRRRTNQPKCA